MFSQPSNLAQAGFVGIAPHAFTNLFVLRFPPYPLCQSKFSFSNSNTISFTRFSPQATILVHIFIFFMLLLSLNTPPPYIHKQQCWKNVEARERYWSQGLTKKQQETLGGTEGCLELEGGEKWGTKNSLSWQGEARVEEAFKTLFFSISFPACLGTIKSLPLKLEQQRGLER